MIQVETVQIIFKSRKIITYSTDYQEGEDMINQKYITSISVDSLTDTKEVIFYSKYNALHGFSFHNNKNIKEIKVLKEYIL